SWAAVAPRATQDLFGRSFRVTKQRGEPLDFPFAPLVMATIHPSAILRADDDQREAEYRRFVEDLEALARGVSEVREAS
ncbi:MAG TPA: hypothetical protein VG602_03555, partial [Actinomycetota bacterium]|nr:hypothetical protein [Actinomycetota bacterium]